MNKPEKIIMWLDVERVKRDPFIDHNGKPLFDYTVRLPYWLTMAYHPRHVKVEVRDKFISYTQRQKEETYEATKKYVKANWAKKCSDLYKKNHGFLLVSTNAIDKGQFKSIRDYEDYHKELRELNRKYLGEKVSP